MMTVLIGATFMPPRISVRDVRGEIGEEHVVGEAGAIRHWDGVIAV